MKAQTNFKFSALSGITNQTKTAQGYIYVREYIYIKLNMVTFGLIAYLSHN